LKHQHNPHQQIRFRNITKGEIAMTDNQFNELFGLVTKAVNKLNVVEEKIDNLEKGQEELRRGQDELRQGQDELRQGQDELRQEFHEFREETRSNFEKVSREISGQQRKIAYLAEQFLEIKAENKDLRERVEALEERNAA
jgi:predicted RNase H-like nuclease (RuvC/YqgF family)